MCQSVKSNNVLLGYTGIRWSYSRKPSQGQWTVVDSKCCNFLMRTCACMYAGNISLILLSGTVHCPVMGM